VTTYQTVFGGNQISPALDSYNSFAITSATPVQLVWPQETAPNGNLASNIVEFSAASTAAGGLILPNAELVGVGDFILFNNLSSFTQSVSAFGGAVVLSIAPGAVFFLYLQQNTTTAGVWIGFQYGAAISAPNAAALAGAGLLATGSTLSQDIPVLTFNTTPVIIGVNNRAELINWASGAGSGNISLPLSATVGASFYIQVKNSSTSTLTITPQSSDNINANTAGTAITLQPNDSAFVVTDGLGNWFTIGLGTTQPVFFNFQSISVTGLASPIILGTTAGTSLNKIAYKFTGVLTTNMIVVLPAYAQTYWINNQTTGAFTLTFQVGNPTPAGSTQIVPSNTQEILYTDGANVINAVSGAGGISVPVIISQGGTGATTASGALTNLGGTSIGIAVFEATSDSAAQTAIAASSFADAMVCGMIL
jgi:hypothetical protein